MSKKIGKKEVERFEEIDIKLTSLNPRNGGVSYARDLAMEAKIKYGLLCENFGKNKVDRFLAESNLNIEVLQDQDRYVEIFKKIKEI